MIQERAFGPPGQSVTKQGQSVARRLARFTQPARAALPLDPLHRRPPPSDLLGTSGAGSFLCVFNQRGKISARDNTTGMLIAKTGHQNVQRTAYEWFRIRKAACFLQQYR